MNLLGWLKRGLILSLYAAAEAQYTVEPKGTITKEGVGSDLAHSAIMDVGVSEDGNNTRVIVSTLPRYFDPEANAITAWMMQEAGFRLTVLPSFIKENTGWGVENKMFYLNVRQLSNPPDYAAQVLWGAIWSCFQEVLNKLIVRHSPQRLMGVSYVWEVTLKELAPAIERAFEKVSLILDIYLQSNIKKQGYMIDFGQNDLLRTVGEERINDAQDRSTSSEDLTFFLELLKYFKRYVPLSREISLASENIEHIMKTTGYESNHSVLEAIRNGQHWITQQTISSYRVYPRVVSEGEPSVLIGSFVDGKVKTVQGGLQAFLLDALQLMEGVALETSEGRYTPVGPNSRNIPDLFSRNSRIAMVDTMLRVLMKQPDLARLIAPEWEGYHNKRICETPMPNRSSFFICKRGEPDSLVTSSLGEEFFSVYASTVKVSVTSGGGVMM